jgi:hypothetical protein
MNAGRNYQCEKTASIYPLFFYRLSGVNSICDWQSLVRHSKSENGMVIEHIENPVLKKDESPARLQGQYQQF